MGTMGLRNSIVKTLLVNYHNTSVCGSIQITGWSVRSARLCSLTLLVSFGSL